MSDLSDFFLKKFFQEMEIQYLEGTNKLLNSQILQMHNRAGEISEKDLHQVEDDKKRIAEMENEQLEMAQMFDNLTTYVKSMIERLNGYHTKFYEMVNGFKSLEENHDKSLPRLQKKLRAAIKKVKLMEEKNYKKNKEQEYEKESQNDEELKDKFSQLEQELKKKSEEIAQLTTKLAKENLDKKPPPVEEKRSPIYDYDEDSLSSFTCFSDSYETKTKKTFKYCTNEKSISMDKSMAYERLRKRDYVKVTTDTESTSGENGKAMGNKKAKK